MHCHRFVAALVLMVVSGCSVALGQDKKQISDEQRAAHLKHMKKVAESIKLLLKPTDPESAADLKAEPILRYADNSRFNNESTLWLWTAGKRPAAVVAIEYYPRHPQGPRWLFEVASLSRQRIAAQCDPHLAWTAKEPGLALRPLEDSKAVADKATRRLSQMKEICRRFTAHESAVIEGRVELRLLNSPLYRYADAEAGVIDGAIFAFANGTNPEVLLILEANQKEKGGEGAWQYALVQMTGGAVAVELDEAEVWQRGEADPPATRDSYVNGWLPSDVSGE
jgi:hypothetical protein